MIERTPIDMDDMLQSIEVPDFGRALESFKLPCHKDKDIFAIQERKGWDKTIEARCDFSRHIRLTRRASVFFFSIWQKTILGRTLTDIKSDEEMIPFFAENVSNLIKEIIGDSLKIADWCIITTPKRRHLVKNFATQISEKIGELLDIPFYEDVCSCQTRQKINATFTVNVIPKENNIICFDDFVTTGSTLASMKAALAPHNKNMLFFAGINNKL